MFYKDYIKPCCDRFFALLLLLLFAPIIALCAILVRVTTPAKAKELGSDYIVVGRPILKAADPVAAYRRCMEEFVD